MSTFALKSRRRRKWPKLPKPPLIFYVCLGLLVYGYVTVNHHAEFAQDISYSKLLSSGYASSSLFSSIFSMGVYILVCYFVSEGILGRYEYIYLPLMASIYLGNYIGQLSLFQQADEISIVIKIVLTLVEKYIGDIILRQLPNYTPPD